MESDFEHPVADPSPPGQTKHSEPHFENCDEKRTISLTQADT